MLDYVFTWRQLASVVVMIEPEYTAPIRVVERVGFDTYPLLEFHQRPVRVYRLARLQRDTQAPSVASTSSEHNARPLRLADTCSHACLPGAPPLLDQHQGIRPQGAVCGWRTGCAD